MLAYYPYVPISHGVRIGTAILSYNGQLAFGITGDDQTAADIDVLAAGIKAGTTELYELASRAHRTQATLQREVSPARETLSDSADRPTGQRTRGLEP
jgi:hypothetical protein